MAEQNGNGSIKGLKFDFRTITAFEVDDFLKVFKSSDIRKQAETLAKFCTACPPEWGKYDDPETFGKLPWRGEDGTFNHARSAFMDAFNDPAKN